MDIVAEIARKTWEAASRRPLPEATYRLQFHKGFTFQDARALSSYFRDLGATHAYASPYLKSRPGSTHGYDIVDHSALDPEIGTRDDFEEWTRSLKDHGLGHILDIVPNHMSVATNENAWWNDVLENGQLSRYAPYFDIEWEIAHRPELSGKVLLPVLGEPYGDTLEAGRLRVELTDGGAFVLSCDDRRFPVAPESYGPILRAADSETSCADVIASSAQLQEMRDPEARASRIASMKQRLAAILADALSTREALERGLGVLNGRPGDPHSFDALHAVLETQRYRLAYWRVAPDEINYRRFFDINDLAALCMERADVFAATHQLPMEFAASGQLDGVRIDHPDGLYDPAQYFRRLQEEFLQRVAQRICQTDPACSATDWDEVKNAVRERLASSFEGSEPPLYAVAEKILGAGEPLPTSWPIRGTSGYDFLNVINGLFVDSFQADAFTDRYSDWVRDDSRFAEIAYRKKLLILQMSLASELNMLTQQLDRLAQKSRKSRDFTFNTLRRALREVIACFPVYRSYITDQTIGETDRHHIHLAIRRARRRNPLMSGRVFEFIRRMLLQESPESFSDEDRQEQLRFAGKFQQVTAPVTAKGIEDTAFYVYNRLISLNEVGGEPDRFGRTPAEVHAFLQTRQALWPYALSPLSTHDSKRGEDVRARINVLSEMTQEWFERLARWSEMNAPHRVRFDDESAPDRGEESLFYQTLIGAWPFEPMTPENRRAFVKRIQDYMEKAIREAKVHTSWINPDEDYDKAIATFIEKALDPELNSEFLRDFSEFQRKVSRHGCLNSLAQTLLQLTSPGVPDLYQGTELWNLSLVDPDNRRPVDYGQRREWLRGLRDVRPEDRLALASRLAERMEDGRIKLYVTSSALALRQSHPGLFSNGGYAPLETAGSRQNHLFAFRRDGEGTQAIVAVPRLTVRLAPFDVLPLGAKVWGDTRVILKDATDERAWRNVYTGEIVRPDSHGPALELRAADLFARFPIALCVPVKD